MKINKKVSGCLVEGDIKEEKAGMKFKIKVSGKNCGKIAEEFKDKNP